MCDDGRPDRLGHGQLREDLHELEGARHAARGERHGSDAGDVLSLEVDLAIGRHQQAGEKIDQRRLARAVGPDDRDELAGADGNRDVVERAEGAVVLGHAACFNERGHRAASNRRRRSMRDSPPVVSKTRLRHDDGEGLGVG